MVYLPFPEIPKLPFTNFLGYSHNIIKATYRKPIDNTLLNGERKIKASLLALVTRQEFLLSLLVFNTAIKVLAKAIRQIRDR